MKVYYAKQSFRTEGEPTVYVREGSAPGIALDPRFDLQNHSPDGFSWGYGGSGPAQLALAILAHLYDDEKALAYYQAFKFKVIAGLDQDQGFELSEGAINKVIETLELERAGREAESQP